MSEAGNVVLEARRLSKSFPVVKKKITHAALPRKSGSSC